MELKEAPTLHHKMHYPHDLPVEDDLVISSTSVKWKVSFHWRKRRKKLIVTLPNVPIQPLWPSSIVFQFRT